MIRFFDSPSARRVYAYRRGPRPKMLCGTNALEELPVVILRSWWEGVSCGTTCSRPKHNPSLFLSAARPPEHPALAVRQRVSHSGLCVIHTTLQSELYRKLNVSANRELGHVFFVASCGSSESEARMSPVGFTIKFVHPSTSDLY